MRSLFLLSIIVAMGSSGLRADNYQTGTDLFKRGSFAEAIPHFEEAIRERPSWFAPYMLQGRCHLKLEEYQKALMQLKEALLLDMPEGYQAGIRYHIAQAYMGMEEYGTAAEIFGELAPRAPAARRPGLHVNVASCYLALAKKHADSDATRAVNYFRKSVASFSEALELSGSKRDVRREAAFQRAWGRMGIADLTDNPAMLQQGAEELAAYLAEDPGARRAYRFLIDLDFLMVKRGYEVERAYQQALTHLDGYLAQWRDDARMIHFKGQAYQGLERYDEAIAGFREAIRLEPGNGKYLFSLGSCQMAAGRYNEAIATLDKARVNGEAANPDLYFYSASSYTQQKTGCFVDDLPLIEKAIEVLSEGVGAVEGDDKATLESLLTRQQHNRDVLRENVRTDNENHRTVLENIRDITATIAGNTAKLQRARENNITTPTEELAANIAELAALIDQDKQRLDAEYAQLETYIRGARKCGGENAFTHLAEMRAKLETR